MTIHYRLNDFEIILEVKQNDSKQVYQKSKAGIGLNICLSNNTNDDWHYKRQHEKVCLCVLRSQC